MFWKDDKAEIEAQRRSIESMSKQVTSYQRLFSGDLGQEVLADLMDNFFSIRSSFDRDPYQTAFNEGSRNVILFILRQIKTDPKKYSKMIDVIEKQQ